MSTMRRPSKSDTCALALEITSASAHAINGAGCFRPRRITMLALFCRAEVHMIFSLYREVLLRRNRTVGRGDRHRTKSWPVPVFYEPATHLFHRDDGRLLGRRRQQRVRAALQLAGPLGGHDDETVSALLRVVRNRAVRVIARNLVAHAWKILYFLK